MNRRSVQQTDSLEMLLDTMCNTFGGIILLAGLVTRLTSRERHGSAATASDTQEMLQRRLAMAQADLQEALQFQTSLQTKANDERWKAQVSLLVDKPRLGRPGRVKGTRELVVVRTPFIVAYRIIGKSVQILRVLHGAQQWPERFPR